MKVHIKNNYFLPTFFSRLKRSEQALEKAEAALPAAEERCSEGPEKVNNKRLQEAQAAKATAVAAKKAEGGSIEEGEEDVGEGDWERTTEEKLSSDLKDAKDAVNHAKSYLIGGCCFRCCFGCCGGC